MPPPHSHGPKKVAGDFVTTVLVLGLVFVLIGGWLLEGLAWLINAYGDMMRAIFGS